MKTILISGGAGYIGTALSQQLLKKYKIIVYDKLYFPWIYKNRKKIKFNKNLSFIKKNISEVRIKDFKDVIVKEFCIKRYNKGMLNKKPTQVALENDNS